MKEKMLKAAVIIAVAAIWIVKGVLSYRLSRETVPFHYSIKIRPDFDEERFEGEVSIRFRSNYNNDKVLLHASELNITQATLNGRKALWQEEGGDLLSVRSENGSVQPGEHVLRFKYEGGLTEKQYGFVKAPYHYVDEKTFVYVTDLEPNYARTVFPCFDEPYFKAKFKVRLISPNETYRAISNMPQISKFSTSSGTLYDFETSPLMSTYLVSFAFTPYDYYEDELVHDGRTYPIRIFSMVASEENSGFAMNCTKEALRFYSEYTGINYPLPKLDMIEYERNETAATENWGLITFRKGLLTPSLEIFLKSQIEIVIHHEISHFWFGNLVTNDWWNDLWLQEGFANYMSYKLFAKTENTTQLSNMKSFRYDYFQEIELQSDGDPVVSDMPYEDDVPRKFTNLVYDKGAALLLMLESAIGEKKFQQAIRIFLSKNAFKTATTNDFIEVLEEIVPDMPTRSFIEGFVYQKKFPLLLVERDKNGTYLLKQKVCESSNGSSDSKWTFPIAYITDKNESKLSWFDKDMDVLEIHLDAAQWIILNPDGVGMYKVLLSQNVQNETFKIFKHIDQPTTATVISNALYLFVNNLTSCDFLIGLMRSTEDNMKWRNFSEFYHLMMINLACQEYVEEAKLFWHFVLARFNETNYKVKLPFVRCGAPEIFEGSNHIDLKQCASWLNDNLVETEENKV